MNTLAANIASTCPLAFSGAGGELFLRAVTTLLAAHCSIVDNGEWPPDTSKEVIEKSKGGGSYDFIVVGAGTAGSLVASQLSNLDPKWSILLVEAGEDPDLNSEVPAFLFLNQNTSNDWKYETEPHERSCLGFENNNCIWSKGKCMGGSSSINAMLYVRGHPKDFAKWGNDWKYRELLPYFANVEKYLNISDNVHVDDNAWYQIIAEAWKELRFATHKHKDHEALIGTTIVKLLTRNGKRVNTAKVYLQHSSKSMHVMKRALVEKIIIDPEAKKASRVIIRNEDGSVLNVMASKEVILSTGSIATPQLLMLSGIGPKNHLNEIGIPNILNLPVGQNLQDHLIVPLFLETNIETQFSPETRQLFLLQYMLNRSGPFSNIGITDFVGFLNTVNSSDQPDIQFHHMFYPKSDKVSLRLYLEGVGFKKDIVNNIVALNDKSDLLGLYPTLLHPKSKGIVKLQRKITNLKPIIGTNYLENPDDVKTLIDAIKFVHKLEHTEIFKTLGIRIVDITIKGCSKYIFDTDLYWKCYLSYMGMTIFHPVGTAKMGNDEMSVVDNDLLVRGMKNLRIVDASIMPSMPSANVMATTLVIAEKAVDIIRMKHTQKEEL